MNAKKNFVFLIFCLLQTFLLPNYANAALVFTFEAAGVQSTTVQAGEYNVETFNNGKAGSSVIGSFSGSYTVKTADQYGGASGTKYAFCNDGTPLSLSFPEPVGYFGFWWSAGDDGNILEITTADGNTRQYTTADLKGGGLLGNSNTSLYYGNPNDNPIARQNRRNTGEPYAFLNFFATDDASKITKVKLRGANFEADNFTTAVNRQPITGTPAEKGKVCSAPQSAGTYPNCSCPTGTSLNKAGSACVPTSGTACTAITNPLPNIPAGSDYDGKKITICHFPPGNPNNVQKITISINALQTHLSHHGDAIWEEGKNCPASTTSCDTPPTVDLGQKATDYAVPVITGGVFGTSTSLTITVKNLATNVVTSIGTATKTVANGWTVTGATKLAAGTYDVIATGDTGLVDTSSSELTVSGVPILTGRKRTLRDFSLV